jgi:AbrB family looped-hinge helix DNA binding protein
MVMVSFHGMKQTSVPIDQAGRVVLPKDVREELAIKPGDTFKVTIHGSSVTLTPNKEEAGFIRKGKALVFSTEGDEMLNQETLRRILEEVRAERDEANAGQLGGRKRSK